MKGDYGNEILCNGLKAGNERIFDYLFASYYSGLVVFACRFGLRQADAEDIVQDVFVKLWHQHSSIEIRSSLKSFLFTTVANKVKDYFKHEKVKQTMEDYFMNLSANGELCAAKDFVIEKELRESIDAAIDRLPEKCRRIFIQYKIEKMGIDEIASLENISRKTVEIHLGKAYRILRQNLQHILFWFYLFILYQ